MDYQLLIARQPLFFTRLLAEILGSFVIWAVNCGLLTRDFGEETAFRNSQFGEWHIWFVYPIFRNGFECGWWPVIGLLNETASSAKTAKERISK